MANFGFRLAPIGQGSWEPKPKNNSFDDNEEVWEVDLNSPDFKVEPGNEPPPIEIQRDLSAFNNPAKKNRRNRKKSRRNNHSRYNRSRRNNRSRRTHRN